MRAFSFSARLALVGIFLVGVVKPVEALSFHIPTTTKDGATALSRAISINNGTCEIEVAGLEEIDGLGRTIGHILHLPHSKMERFEIVARKRPQWAQNALCGCSTIIQLSTIVASASPLLIRR